MCDIKMTRGENDDIDIICTISGKPITETSDFGMQCEDRCHEKENKEFYTNIFKQFK